MKEHVSIKINETRDVKRRHRKSVNKVLGKYIILTRVLYWICSCSSSVALQPNADLTCLVVEI